MLPPGHAAAGFLLSVAATQLIGIEQHDPRWPWYVGVGVAASVIPDLDMFFSFVRMKRAVIGRGRYNHRHFVTHTPFFWLTISGIALLFTRDPLATMTPLFVLLGSLSHLVFDSIQYGVMWLWPFSSRLHSIRDTGKEITVTHTRGFFSYWIGFTQEYIHNFQLTFFCELGIGVAALLTFFSIVL